MAMQQNFRPSVDRAAALPAVWSTLQSHRLGEVLDFDSEGTLLIAFDRVSTAVNALAMGDSRGIPDNVYREGYCIVFHKKQRMHYLLFRSDSGTIVEEKFNVLTSSADVFQKTEDAGPIAVSVETVGATGNTEQRSPEVNGELMLMYICLLLAPMTVCLFLHMVAVSALMAQEGIFRSRDLVVSCCSTVFLFMNQRKQVALGSIVIAAVLATSSNFLVSYKAMAKHQNFRPTVDKAAACPAVWCTLQRHRLGEILDFDSEGTLLIAFDRVSTAVNALATGDSGIPDNVYREGYCIVFDKEQRMHYLLFRSDSRTIVEEKFKV